MSDLYATGIRPFIDEHLRREAEQQAYPTYFRMSSAGYCHRYIIMKRLGVPPVPEREEDGDRTTRVFRSGHVFHQWLQEVTEKAGVSMYQEVELTDETNEEEVIGHFDDLVLLRDSYLILYDYKTAHSGYFGYDDKINTYHRLQLGTYFLTLKKIGAGVENVEAWKVVDDENKVITEDVRKLVKKYHFEESRILTMSKDDLRMQEKQLMWSEQLEADVKRYWEGLHAAWNRYLKDRVLPPCTCLTIDGGWFGRRSKKGKVYNDYFFAEEPCSQRWFDQWMDKK